MFDSIDGVEFSVRRGELLDPELFAAVSRPPVVHDGLVFAVAFSEEVFGAFRCVFSVGQRLGIDFYFVRLAGFFEEVQHAIFLELGGDFILCSEYRILILRRYFHGGTLG